MHSALQRSEDRLVGVVDPEHHTEISEHDGKYLYLMNRVSGPTLIPLLVLSTHI